MDLEVPTRFERDWDREVEDAPLRVAVIGLGWFGRDVALPAIEDSDYCEATAVVSGSPEKAAAVADEHDADVALTYDEYGAGEGADAYDAVYVVTPNALHLPHVETAAELDKAVLCEKPLEATAERATALVEAAEEGGVPLMTAYRMQTARSMRWVREQIRDGVIGDPVQIHGEFSFSILGGDGDPDQWRLSEDLAGGGALMDIGIYPMNTARFVLDADPVGVQATYHATGPAFEGVDEHVAFQLEFPDAATASCTASFGAKATSRFAVLGTEGQIVVDDPFGVAADREVTVETHRGRISCTGEEPSEMVEEFDYFAAAVLNDEEIRPDGRHGLVDVEIAEAVYESHDTGRRIEF